MAKVIKELWVKPYLPTMNMNSVKEFSFGFKDPKDREYIVKVKNNDRLSFLKFCHIIIDSIGKAEKNKGQTISPWPLISGIKDKVTIEKPNEEKVEQMELSLKVARAFAAKS